jgi:hypothetical protein
MKTNRTRAAEPPEGCWRLWRRTTSKGRQGRGCIVWPGQRSGRPARRSRSAPWFDGELLWERRLCEKTGCRKEGGAVSLEQTRRIDRGGETSHDLWSRVEDERLIWP